VNLNQTVAVDKNNQLLFKKAALPRHNDQNHPDKTDANETS
jgi:hypothetical protein